MANLLPQPRGEARERLRGSWPLSEQPRHFELGLLLSCAVTDLLPPPNTGDLGWHHAGCWECDLANDALTWSGGVYDIFGLARGVPVTRDLALGLYSEDSRAKLERLRSDAIRRGRGFTLDAEVRALSGEGRWMRLIAAPAGDGEPVLRLHGIKLVI